MPEGIFVVSVEFTNAANHVSFAILLDNGTFVVTPADATYPAPWGIVRAGAEGTAVQIVENQLIVDGKGGSFYGELVFSSDSDTIEGVLARFDDSVEASVTLPPDRLSFAPGSNELPFRVTFRSVNDPGVQIDTPEWARGRRPARRR